MTELIESRRKELKVKEYAKLERVSEITVRRWIAKGALKVKRIGVGKLIRIVVS